MFETLMPISRCGELQRRGEIVFVEKKCRREKGFFNPLVRKSGILCLLDKKAQLFASEPVKCAPAAELCKAQETANCNRRTAGLPAKIA